MFKRKEYKEKQLRYSIRKVSFGAASVAISALYLLMGSAAVSASEVQAVNGDQTTVTNPTVKDNEDKSRIEKHETTTEAASSAVVTLDKTSLTKLIEEIDGKFTSGKYASKTEDSVNKLKAALEEARTALSNAKAQAELTQAHANLIVATTKLQTKPEDKKEAPAVDTTNGKPTVGKKATNTEKASDSNSIANSGSRDERNGKALDRSNPFRTDSSTTDTDPSANQTYTAPAENADLNEIASELQKLPDTVQNNTKIQDMNDLGDKTGVARGDVKEIQEFGGWKAINQPDGTPGKFAIARKTESGIFPVETVNTVYTNINRGRAEYYDTYVGEQAFDRSKDYMLFLGKVRTIASETEQTFNGQPYKRSGLGGSDSFAIKSFNGIEKTFKAHSPATGSKVKVAFKTGFTGDLNGTKANYLVEVVYRQNNSEVTAYTYSFEPQPRKTLTNEKGIVTPAKDGTGRAFVRSDFNNYTLNKAEVEAKMAEAAYKPNGQAGTFTSSDIDLPVGVTEYTVRIKVTNTERMGMGYQSPLRHYALPVTGLDFSIEQDTRKLAKNLLQRVYDKLKATEERDIKGKTEATINAYKTQLENVKNLLDGELSSTRTYKDIVTAVLADQQALRTDKSKLTASNNNLLGLINEDPDPRIGKTPISKEPYNTAKDEAIKAREKAQTILDQENPDPDVVAAAVSKLNEKLAELKAAKAELVVAATEAQKTKLAADKAKLVEASKEGKTQDSINAYEAKYNALKSELDKAVAAANDVANAQENASKVSALEAQEKVTEVLAKLEEAKALLKDKATDAQIAELKKAEKALTPISDDNLGNKKPTSVQKYKDAVATIQPELTETKTKVAELLEKAKTDNAAKEEAAQLISKVDALKSKLTDAATLLEDKANTGGLETAKNELKEAVAEEVTAGKTPETVGSYNTAKQAADDAVKAAEAVLSNPNATQEAVNAALQTVTEKKAALAAAKKALVEAATPEQKTTLATDAAALVPASKEGKTPESITAYEARLQELNGELTAAKQAAEAIAAKGENASKDAAIEAQAKVSAIKAKLADAATLLKDKANTSALETAKNELKEAVAEEVTAGKTPETVGSYNTAKQAADEAVK
ncbi:YSIRK-type signal peptide-containing protein, partial [uncultured Granulicatella sp.]|uniref:YSIRK-type signal peptide-containing protein n=1 Tax=uncultured Granulicatella sp. TaxID=316089 RepID=UPI0028D894FA